MSEDERGPCHVGHHHPTRCHDLNGQGVKQWFAGRTEAQGLDVCDAYACKKKAGLEVEGAARRGLDPVRKNKKQKAAAEPSGGSSGGGSAGGGGGSSAGGGARAAAELVTVEQVIGHELLGELDAGDERRIEPRAPDGFNVQLRVRGYFRRGPNAMVWPNTRWLGL